MAAPTIRLNPGEQILRDELPSALWTMGFYVLTLGLWAVWRRRHRFVLTNQRVMVLKGIVNKSERSVPLARIQDVNLRTSIATGGFVALSSAGGPLGIQGFGPFTRAGAVAFADALSQAIPFHGDGVSGAHVAGASGASVSQELERLVRLRDSGALTEEEFAAQKVKVLG
jgi:hypothetical protein